MLRSPNGACLPSDCLPGLFPAFVGHLRRNFVTAERQRLLSDLFFFSTCYEFHSCPRPIAPACRHRTGRLQWASRPVPNCNGPSFERHGARHRGQSTFPAHPWPRSLRKRHESGSAARPSDAIARGKPNALMTVSLTRIGLASAWPGRSGPGPVPYLLISLSTGQFASLCRGGLSVVPCRFSGVGNCGK